MSTDDRDIRLILAHDGWNLDFVYRNRNFLARCDNLCINCLYVYTVSGKGAVHLFLTMFLTLHFETSWCAEKAWIKTAASPPIHCCTTLRNLFFDSTTNYMYMIFFFNLPMTVDNIRKNAARKERKKKAQLTQRERATAVHWVHVWRPSANKCKIHKNLYFSAQGHSRSLLSVSIETRVWLPVSD